MENSESNASKPSQVIELIQEALNKRGRNESFAKKGLPLGRSLPVDIEFIVESAEPQEHVVSGRLLGRAPRWKALHLLSSTSFRIDEIVTVVIKEPKFFSFSGKVTACMEMSEAIVGGSEYRYHVGLVPCME